MKKLKTMLVIASAIIVIILALPLALRAWVHARAEGKIYKVGDVPPAPVALVLGTGLERNGSPTPALYDRVAAAVDLYKASKVNKLLMSGDNLAYPHTLHAALVILSPDHGLDVQHKAVNLCACCVVNRNLRASASARLVANVKRIF